jgi:DNA-3-methyladenine glycosylase
MPSSLPQYFYARETEVVARELIGARLVRKENDRRCSGIIVETEAYIGPHDKACHAHKGRTKRTETMFAAPGTWYVYSIYGMYNCLNIVTREKGYPAAVLIRAIEPDEGVETMRSRRKKRKLTDLASGPGKLCIALGITKEFNTTKATTPSSKLFLEYSRKAIRKEEIMCSARIGVEYAQEWAQAPLRFFLKNNPHVSMLRNRSIDKTLR